MLAALAGFENKTDKYVMQRLLRMGDLNRASPEVSFFSFQTFYFHDFAVELSIISFVMEKLDLLFHSSKERKENLYPISEKRRRPTRN